MTHYQPALSPEQHREKAKIVLANSVPSISELNDRILALIGHAVTALEADALSGMGYKALTLDVKWLEKLEALAKTISSQSANQARAEKTEAAKLKKMTTEQKLQWMKGYVLTLPNEQRVKFIQALIRSHNATPNLLGRRLNDLPSEEPEPDGE